MKGWKKRTGRAASLNAAGRRVCHEYPVMGLGFAGGVFCVVWLFSAPVFAEDALEEVVPVEVETPARDPFWPVGYTPPEPRPDTGVDADDEALARDRAAMTWPALTVRGRARGPDGAYRVLIEGVGVARPGDVVSRQRDGLWFHRRVTHLDGDGMRLVRLGVTQEKSPGEDWLRERETAPETIEETEP